MHVSAQHATGQAYLSGRPGGSFNWPGASSSTAAALSQTSAAAWSPTAAGQRQRRQCQAKRGTHSTVCHDARVNAEQAAWTEAPQPQRSVCVPTTGRHHRHWRQAPREAHLARSWGAGLQHPQPGAAAHRPFPVPAAAQAWSIRPSFHCIWATDGPGPQATNHTPAVPHLCTLLHGGVRPLPVWCAASSRLWAWLAAS